MEGSPHLSSLQWLCGPCQQRTSARICLLPHKAERQNAVVTAWCSEEAYSRVPQCLTIQVGPVLIDRTTSLSDFCLPEHPAGVSLDLIELQRILTGPSISQVWSTSLRARVLTRFRSPVRGCSITSGAELVRFSQMPEKLRLRIAQVLRKISERTRSHNFGSLPSLMTRSKSSNCKLGSFQARDFRWSSR